MSDVNFCRVWDTFNCIMIHEPYRVTNRDSEHEEFADNDSRYVATHGYYGDWQDVEDGVKRPCNLMKYAGKIKDKFPIYEGDIVKYVEGVELGDKIAYYGIVQYEVYSGCFGLVFQLDDDPVNYFWEGVVRIIEVVGNIYENPEIKIGVINV